jgi:hypothetical protein
MSKVRIGIHYEPKWFERRATQGTYSGKNVPLDADAMWLQTRLIGQPRKPLIAYWKTKILICAGVTAWLIVYFTKIGVL